MTLDNKDIFGWKDEAFRAREERREATKARAHWQTAYNDKCQENERLKRQLSEETVLVKCITKKKARYFLALKRCEELTKEEPEIVIISAVHKVAREALARLERGE